MRQPTVSLRRRILYVLAAFLLIFLSLIFRVGWIQLVQGAELRQEAQQFRTREIQIQPKRGTVMDREGRDLAVSVDVDSLFAVPTEIQDVQQTARALADVLEHQEEELFDRLSRSASFVWIARKLNPETAQQVRELDLRGLHFTRESQRVYPKGSLASHVLGFAGIDSQGLEGLERSYDEILTGEPGKIVMEFDAEGREIPQAVYRHVPSRQGKHIYLTIDEVIQYIAERELSHAIQETGAKGGSILVMDPSNGDVLALAARPDYDPNQWAEFPPQLWRNPAISNTEHPGSVFKPVIAAAALETGRVTPETTFYDPGYVQVPGATIHNWDREGLGSTDFATGFIKSANVIFVKTGLRLGLDEFYLYLERFGLDSTTGIALPGEAHAIIPEKDSAREVDLAVMSFGQTLSITAIQMTTALAALVNGGMLLQPRLVREIEDAETGQVTENRTTVLHQVVSEDTSSTLRQLMVNTVEDGTGSRAQIPGYTAGGKTGTAQKTVDGVVSRDRHVASFAGFAPADEPAVVCLISLDEPQEHYYGGLVAAPVFRQVMKETLRHLGIAPDDPESLQDSPPDVTQEIEQYDPVAVPQVKGMPLDEAGEILQEGGFEYSVVGDGAEVLHQFPSSGVKMRPGATVMLYTEEEKEYLEGEAVDVPDVRGMSLRRAAERLNDIGLRIQVSGSGVVVEQNPQPGTEVQRGDIVHLSLESPGS